jgi:hypothetical protein
MYPFFKIMVSYSMNNSMIVDIVKKEGRYFSKISIENSLMLFLQYNVVNGHHHQLHNN